MYVYMFRYVGFGLFYCFGLHGCSIHAIEQAKSLVFIAQGHDGFYHVWSAEALSEKTS